MPTSNQKYVALLLAAGRGSRFDPTGARNKLLQPLADGERVVTRTARTLLAVVPEVVAIVRSDEEELADTLRAAGCEVISCPTADQGMASSLVQGIKATSSAAGWIIALGDMPWVQTVTVQKILQALRDGSDIVVPVSEGRRGNPVGFSRRHLAALSDLRGDHGARQLLKTCPVNEIEVRDSGIWRDVDTASDLD